MSCICEYCNCLLSNKYTLKRHQQTNKKCLSLRGKPEEEFKCTKCLRIYNRVDNFNDHMKICNNNINPKKEFKEEIKKEPLLLSLEYLKSKLNLFTIEILENGSNSISNYFLSLIKDRVFCLDDSRGKVEFYDEYNKLRIDKKSVLLSKLLFSSIKDKCVLFGDVRWKQYMDISDKDKLGCIFRDRDNFRDNILSIARASRGNNDKFTNTIINYLVCQLLDKNDLKV